MTPLFMRLMQLSTGLFEGSSMGIPMKPLGRFEIIRRNQPFRAKVCMVDRPQDSLLPETITETWRGLLIGGLF